METIHFTGPEHIFLSIYEGGSEDKSSSIIQAGVNHFRAMELGGIDVNTDIIFRTACGGAVPHPRSPGEHSQHDFHVPMDNIYGTESDILLSITIMSQLQCYKVWLYYNSQFKSDN
jgi:hypothetical protein